MKRTRELGSLILAAVVLLLFGFFGSVCSGGENATPDMGHDGADDVVVARVNGVEINMAQLMEKMLGLAKKKYGRREISDLVALKIKDDAMDALVKEELAYQKAFAVVGQTSEEMVGKRIVAMIKGRGGEDGFAEFLKDENLNLEELKIMLTRTLTVERYVEQEINAKITISDNEINAAYKGAKEKYFVQHEEVQVTKIIFFLDPAERETLSKIKALREIIISELDEDATKLVPDGTFIVQQNIKLHKLGSKKLYDIAKELGPYGISGPVEVDGTLNMVQLTGFKPEISKDLDEVREYLVGELKKRKKQARLDDWIAGLRVGANVEIVEIME